MSDRCDAQQRRDAEQQRVQPPLQVQKQDGQRQSQQQGGRPAEKTPRTTADPGADGQSVYDLQDEEARERDDAQPVRPRPALPDSNAM